MTEVLVSRKNIVEVFPVSKPFSYAILVKDPLTHEVVYEVVEPTILEEEREQFEMIRTFLIETLDVIMSELGSEEDAKKYLRKKVYEIIKTYRIRVKKTSFEKMLYYFIRDYIGYGKIDVMMKEHMIEDISCNGVNVPIYIWHREYESIPTNIIFPSEEELDNFLIRLAYRTGRMISIARPVLDATLPDGSRINMTLGREVTKHGSTFTIRKFREDPLTITDMIKYNTVSSEMAALFWYLIENKHSIFICGATATGKTTLLNVFSSFIKPDEKIVTIEDTPELQLYHKNWIRSVSRPSVGTSSQIDLFDLLKSAMRQRPDYIIVGEIRGQEAYTLFQAMATGHLGMSTLHADNIEGVIHRLEAEPMNTPRNLIAGLDVVTIQRRLERDGKPIRRTVVATEIVSLDPRTNEILTNEIFRWDAATDNYIYSGRSYLLEKIAQTRGISLREVREDIKKRQTILDWMSRQNIRTFHDVTGILRNYYADPEEVYKMTQVGV